MYFCLRIDLDYVPWGLSDSSDLGHGEPAQLLKLLELARQVNQTFHFFSSRRALGAFPTASSAILDDGHDLDWLCTKPDQMDEEWHRLLEHPAIRQVVPLGMAVPDDWPQAVEVPSKTLSFVSCRGPNFPVTPPHFEITSRSDREAWSAGNTARKWTDEVKAGMRDSASRQLGFTLQIHPIVMARFDSSLQHLHEIIEFALALDLPIRTLRSLSEN